MPRKITKLRTNLSQVGSAVVEFEPQDPQYVDLAAALEHEMDHLPGPVDPEQSVAYLGIRILGLM